MANFSKFDVTTQSDEQATRHEEEQEFLSESAEEDSHEEFDGQPAEYDEWGDCYGVDDSIYEWDCDLMFDC